jgi:hypothetical protein
MTQSVPRIDSDSYRKGHDASVTCTRVAGLVAIFLSMFGCPGPSESDTPKTERFSGWVRFYGEFLLYSEKRDLDRGIRASCISGSLPLQAERRAAELFNGKHVVIYGQREPWFVASPLQLSEPYKGSNIENQCAGKFIILATKIVPFD